jgi:ribonuclease P protein component
MARRSVERLAAVNFVPVTLGETAPRLRFPRAARLTRTGEFRRVKERGRSFGGRFIVLGVLREAEPGRATRLGLITSRRVGGAVVRNGVRRRLRAAIRLSRPRLRAGAWVVVIARQQAANATAADLAAEWLRLAERASMLTPLAAASSAPPGTP